MTITKTQVDDLNAILKVVITKEDYSDKVEKVLKDYRKNAQIPGFRKGAVPMSLIHKQYGKAITVDEVNKLLQDNVNKYLTEEKLDILGNPLPMVSENFDWDAQELEFSFELGLAPQFDIDLKSFAQTHYQVEITEEMIDEQILRLRKSAGNSTEVDTVDASCDVEVFFSNEEEQIEKSGTVNVDTFKDKATFDAFIGKKVDEVVVLQTKGLMRDDHNLMDVFGVSHDKVHSLDVAVEAKIKKISAVEPSVLDEEFFGKFFPNGEVTDEQGLRQRIAVDFKNQVQPQADQFFMNQVVDGLIANVTFDLPKEFLIKWIQNAGEKQLSADEAAVEFENSEKSLRYQLIESKIIRDNDLQVTFDEIKENASAKIRQQMAQFGMLDVSDEQVESIVARVFSKEEEVRRVSDEVMQAKMLNTFLSNAVAAEQTVSYPDFVKITFGE
jgi:trigger factor